MIEQHLAAVRLDRRAALIGDRGIVEGDGAESRSLDHAAVLVEDHGALEKHRTLVVGADVAGVAHLILEEGDRCEGAVGVDPGASLHAHRTVHDQGRIETGGVDVDCPGVVERIRHRESAAVGDLEGRVRVDDEIGDLFGVADSDRLVPHVVDDRRVRRARHDAVAPVRPCSTGLTCHRSRPAGLRTLPRCRPKGRSAT